MSTSNEPPPESDAPNPPSPSSPPDRSPRSSPRKPRKKKDEQSELAVKAEEYSVWYVSALLDTVLVVLWVLLQWGVAQILANFKLSGMDALSQFILQALLGLPSFIPLALYIYRDARIMWIRVNRSIKAEKEKDNDTGKRR